MFEGATAEVNAFLSVASKAAALALVVRVVVGFSFVTGHHLPDPPKTAAVAARCDFVGVAKASGFTTADRYETLANAVAATTTAVKA